MNRRLLPHLTARLFNRPLAVTEERLLELAALLGARADLSPILEAAPPDASALEAAPLRAEAGGESGRGGYAVTSAGVAVVPIVGTLVNRPAGSDCFLTYSRILSRVNAAMNDPGVLGVLLEVDSPGGECDGLFEAADHLLALRGGKPFWAVAAPSAYSAAYTLASAAEKIYVAPFGGVGSVGAIARHADRSKADEMEGVRYTMVFSGARKNDFNANEPLSEQAMVVLRDMVKTADEHVVSRVARARNMKPAAVRALEAGIFLDGKALEAGLADRLGGLSQAHADMAALLGKRAPRGARAERAAPPAAAGEEPPPSPGMDRARARLLHEVMSEA